MIPPTSGYVPVQAIGLYISGDPTLVRKILRRMDRKAIVRQLDAVPRRKPQPPAP